MSRESTPKQSTNPSPEADSQHESGLPYLYEINGSLQTAEAFLKPGTHIAWEAYPYTRAQEFPGRGERKIIFVSEDNHVMYLRGNKLYNSADLAKKFLAPREITEDEPLPDITIGEAHPFFFKNEVEDRVERIKEVVVARKRISRSDPEAAIWRLKAERGGPSTFAELDKVINTLAKYPKSALGRPEAREALPPEELLELKRRDLRQMNLLGPAVMFVAPPSESSIVPVMQAGRITQYKYDPKQPGSPEEQMALAGMRLTPQHRELLEIQRDLGSKRARARLRADDRIVGAEFVTSRHGTPTSPQPTTQYHEVENTEGIKETLPSVRRIEPYQPRITEAANLAIRAAMHDSGQKLKQTIGDMKDKVRYGGDAEKKEQAKRAKAEKRKQRRKL